MPYKVAIRDNATGEIRLCDQSEIEWGEGSLFWWTDGNMGCDCNRHLEFTGATGERDWDGAECSEGRYSALYACLPDGTTIPIEGP